MATLKERIVSASWQAAMRYASAECRRKLGRRQRVYGVWNPLLREWIYHVRNAQRGRPCRHPISKEPR